MSPTVNRVLCSSPGEDGLYSSETKSGRRTAPKPKLFVTNRILQEQRPQLRKTILSWSPDGDGFCSSETKSGRRTAPEPKLFVTNRILQEQRTQLRKTILSWSPDGDGFCSSETKHDRRMELKKICLFRRGGHRSKGHKPENCLGFEFRWKCLV
jgi:hypothetical protein